MRTCGSRCACRPSWAELGSTLDQPHANPSDPGDFVLGWSGSATDRMGAVNLGVLAGAATTNQVFRVDSVPTPDLVTVEARAKYSCNGEPAAVETAYTIPLVGAPEGPQDIDDDNDVDDDDLTTVIDASGSCEGDERYNPDADLNEDGCVDADRAAEPTRRRCGRR